MSSGQKEIVISHLEKLISDDTNDLQSFRAQILSDVVKSIVQRSYSEWDQPGVTVPPAGAVGTPMYGVVLDGLEMLVDSPGNILITKGILGCWNGNPSSDKNSGFLLIDDVGIQTLGVLTIAANAGASPRCDVIECAIDTDDVIQQNRDILDETTELFVPALVNKIVKGKLKYQVFQGTVGVAPGYRAGWLPLGFAIVQPGATVGQIDFYDCRPLYREMDSTASDWNAESVLSSVPERHSNSLVQSIGSGSIAGTKFVGGIDISHNGMRMRGRIMRNAPLKAANLANFNNTTAYTGGDGDGVQLTDENCVMGSSMAPAPNDLIALVSCIPNLGGSRPLPRCVRYSQGTITSPTLPGRRAPHGPNGILLAIAKSQNSIGIEGLVNCGTLNAAGIAGVLGTAFGVVVGVARVAVDGVTTASQATGNGVEDGIPSPTNRIVQAISMMHSGGISTSTTSATPAEVANTRQSFYAKAGDQLDIAIGSLKLATLCTTPSDGELQLQITEDFGVSGTPATIRHFPMEVGGGVTELLSIAMIYPVTKSGIVTVVLFVKGDGTNMMRAISFLDEFGRILQIRP